MISSTLSLSSLGKWHWPGVIIIARPLGITEWGDPLPLFIATISPAGTRISLSSPSFPAFWSYEDIEQVYRARSSSQYHLKKGCKKRKSWFPGALNAFAFAKVPLLLFPSNFRVAFPYHLLKNLTSMILCVYRFVRTLDFSAATWQSASVYKTLCSVGQRKDWQATNGMVGGSWLVWLPIKTIGNS